MNPIYYVDLLAKALKERDESLFEEAINYKNKYIPNKLYKFYSLKSNEELNNRKIKDLSLGKVYMNEISSFNDPFEGHYLYFQEEKLKKYKVNSENILNFLSAFNEIVRMSCFTKNNYQCMPMWAHYSNNHNGYCVEYEINEKNKKYFYDVTYGDHRYHAEEVVFAYMNSLYKKDNIISRYCRLVLYLCYCIKHESWSYEREYRAIALNKDYINLKPTKVYIGYKVSNKNIKQIQQSLRKNRNRTKVYKMINDIDNVKFAIKKIEL